MKLSYKFGVYFIVTLAVVSAGRAWADDTNVLIEAGKRAMAQSDLVSAKRYFRSACEQKNTHSLEYALAS